MGLANKSVVLYQSIKIGNQWTFREVPGDLPKFSKWQLYVSWYDGAQKRMDPVGRDSKHALKMLNKERLELAYVAAGGAVNKSEATTDKDPDQVGCEFFSSCEPDISSTEAA
jgi:hypothetical protein